MTSLFAQQFHWGSPYKPTTWTPGSLTVDAALPKGKTPSTPEETPTETGSNAGKAAEATAGATAAAAAGASVGASAANQAAKQGTMEKLAHLDAGAPATASTDITAPTTRTSGADATTPNLGNGHVGGTGIWGDITGIGGQAMHDLGVAGKTVGHVIQGTLGHNMVPGVKQVSLFPGTTRTSVTPRTVDSNVTEPTNVWNPSSSGSTFQGEGWSAPEGISSGVSRAAIGPSSVSQQFANINNGVRAGKFIGDQQYINQGINGAESAANTAGDMSQPGFWSQVASGAETVSEDAIAGIL